MSGHKQAIDQACCPCLEAAGGRPYALYIHGDSDTTGAISGVEAITTGLKWKRPRGPVMVIGAPDSAAREPVGSWAPPRLPRG